MSIVGWDTRLYWRGNQMLVASTPLTGRMLPWALAPSALFCQRPAAT
jgi:hypothetical protein